MEIQKVVGIEVIKKKYFVSTEKPYIFHNKDDKTKYFIIREIESIPN